VLNAGIPWRMPATAATECAATTARRQRATVHIYWRASTPLLLGVQGNQLGCEDPDAADWLKLGFPTNGGLLLTALGCPSAVPTVGGEAQSDIRAKKSSHASNDFFRCPVVFGCIDLRGLGMGVTENDLGGIKAVIRS